MTRAIKLGFMACIFLSSARAEIFLITGSYNQGWIYQSASRLVRVGTDGAVSSAAMLASGTDGYFVRAGVSYEWKTAAVEVGGKAAAIKFISMVTGRVTKSCELPPYRDQLYWANVPQVGGVLQVEHWNPPPQTDRAKDLIQILATESVPCSESFSRAPRSHLRYATALGAAGVGDFVMGDGFDFSVDELGRVIKGFADKPVIDLGFRLPAWILSRETRFPYLLTRSREVIVISLGSYEQRRTFVLVGTDGRWIEIPSKVSDGFMRGFGPYVAITEAHTKKAVLAQSKMHPGMVEINKQVETEERSAGERAWRKEYGPDGPSLVESFANATVVFPGRLHVFDSRTGRMFSISTNQGDSEILLVSNGTVYYRVSDALYVVPITEKGLGRARLLARNPLIGDAHWAFVRE